VKQNSGLEVELSFIHFVSRTPASQVEYRILGRKKCPSYLAVSMLANVWIGKFIKKNPERRWLIIPSQRGLLLFLRDGGDPDVFAYRGMGFAAAGQARTHERVRDDEKTRIYEAARYGDA